MAVREAVVGLAGLIALCGCGAAAPAAAQTPAERADAALAAALEVSPRPTTLRARRAALESLVNDPPPPGSGRDPLSDAEKTEFYVDYAEDLARWTAVDHALRALSPVAALDAACVGPALNNCTVSSHGTITTGEGGADIAWQAQSGSTDEEGTLGGVVLLRREAAGWKPIAWAYDGYEYWPVTLAVSADGVQRLHGVGVHGGSGGHNADVLFQRDGDGWTDVDIESWRDALPARLPAGLGVWKGVRYDFTALRTSSPLWKADDANCCPTGGRADFAFAVRDGVLTLTEVQARPAE
ncbi:MAG TPA: hypothetical protein VGB49_00405 [Caulobacteraceae bacterium]|jgi:hypothetical protein